MFHFRRVVRRSAGLLLAMLLLTAPAVVLASHRFSDVPGSNQFHDDIDWLADYGIANGFDDGTYRPSQAVTRQAMAAFLHRLSNGFEIVGTTIDPAPSSIFTHFTACTGDKRPLSAGLYNDAGLFITQSYPSGNGWAAEWQSDNDVSVDPANLNIYVLCGPRL